MKSRKFIKLVIGFFNRGALILSGLALQNVMLDGFSESNNTVQAQEQPVVKRPLWGC